jgi:hypothetical protein
MTAVLFAAGVVLLIAGAEMLVRSASRLAAAAGVSPLVIGLTVVAFGTSTPELAVTAGAAVSGQSDIAMGNVVGSNVLSALLILGASALILPLVVPSDLAGHWTSAAAADRPLDGGGSPRGRATKVSAAGRQQPRGRRRHPPRRVALHRHFGRDRA